MPRIGGFHGKFKKDEKLMVTIERNCDNDHSVHVGTLSKEIIGFLVEYDAMKLYPILRHHVYSGKIDIVALANTNGDGSILDVNLKFFTQFYIVGDAKPMEIERKIHTLFP